MILTPSLIEDCVYDMSNNHYVALHIPEVVLGTNFFSRVRSFERSFYNGTVVDGARFFRRDILLLCGGFDEEIFVKGSGEDWDIDKKIKLLGNIGLINTSSQKKINVEWSLSDFIKENIRKYDNKFVGIYHNEINFKLISYLRKKIYYGIGFTGYIKKWGKQDSDIKKQFGFIYRYFIIFTENGKWKKILMNPSLSLGMYFLRFLVGLSYLLSKILKGNL
jgi:hypothetical protein